MYINDTLFKPRLRMAREWIPIMSRHSSRLHGLSRLGSNVTIVCDNSTQDYNFKSKEVWVIDQVRGQDGWILAEFFFLRVYGPRLRLGP